jgi:ribosomal-protein-alanine N-acetyltransferase
VTGWPGALVDPDPELSDGVVRLRPWSDGDLECVREASEEGEIPERTTVPKTFTVAEGLAFVARQQRRRVDGEGMALAIVRSDKDRAVGHVYIAVRPQRRVYGLGYWLALSARGHGYASRAARLAAVWALGPGGGNRIEAWVMTGNVASERVLLAAGFTREGVLRAFLNADEQSADAVVLSRIRGDPVNGG